MPRKEPYARDMKRVLSAVALTLLLVITLSAHAQGCSLCKDATAGSAPRQRQALQRAILIMGLPAGAIFLGILVLARKIKPREDSDANSIQAPN